MDILDYDNNKIICRADYVFVSKEKASSVKERFNNKGYYPLVLDLSENNRNNIFGFKKFDSMLNEGNPNINILKARIALKFSEIDNVKLILKDNNVKIIPRKS